MTLVARSVIVVKKRDSDPGTAKAAPKLLEAFRDYPAWVLLGEPGMGKTTAFDQEATATGGVRLSVADFVVRNDLSALHGKTLFLDGLDEVRGSGGDDNILRLVRERLRQLDQPRFRIACRAADWLGSSDQSLIEGASPDGSFATLQLEPLSADDIATILRTNHGIPDPQAFTERAGSIGIDGLLDNPQTLELLAKSIGDDRWPKTRIDTYRLACEQLAKETSKTHRNRSRSKSLPAKVIDAAGQLCAALLLSDSAGIALDEESSNERFPPLEAFSPPDLAAAQQALGSRLFKLDGEERRVPIHRSVAEFLAAQWLARRIDQQGLPAGRVLNLLLGRDGRTVAGLRGLFGWLASLSSLARTRLLDADTLTVIVYGDVKPLPKADKRRLLAGLRRDADSFPGFRWEHRRTQSFGGLADPDLLDDFVNALSASDRSNEAQAYLDLLLDSLNQGTAIPALKEPLRSVLTDDSRWEVVRKDALQAWLKLAPPAEARTLLDAIHEGTIRDADDELAGALLRNLYPGHLSPLELIEHLHAPKDDHLIGWYALFWRHDLPSRAPATDLPDLLDALHQRRDLHQALTLDFHLREMTGELLVRGVVEHGDHIDDERLYAWLGIGSDEDHTRQLDKDEQRQLAEWFKVRPDRYKGVFAICFKRCEGIENAFACLYKEERRLTGLTPPDDIGRWHLEQIDLTEDESSGKEHLHRAVNSLLWKSGDRGLSLEQVEAWAQKHPHGGEWLSPLLAWEWNPDDWRAKKGLRKRASRTARDERRRLTTINLNTHLPAIKAGKAPAQLMHQLAGVWENRYTDTRGETPAERFAEYCENGAELLPIAEAGFVACITREDLPNVDEIITLSLQQREHFIRAACLVGMDILWRDKPTAVAALPDGTLRRMVAFRLTYGVGNTPAWFLDLVQTRPALVADVLIDYGSRTLKSKLQYIDGLYPLAHDPTYQALARLSVPLLLQRFPTRTTAQRLNTLEYLLKAAMRYRMPELDGLLAAKTALKGMDAPQRVYWLATGLLHDPERYATELWRYVGKSATRANHLSGFLASRHDDMAFGENLSESSLEKMIALVCQGADLGRRNGFVTAAMQRGDHLRALIGRLGSRGTDAAISALTRLLGDPALASARPMLEDARNHAKTQLRENTFRFLPLDGVVAVLANASPASVADLTALTLDHLDDFASNIRRENNDGFRFFWNIDPPKPLTKRPENTCRDVLMTELRHRLRHFSIEVQNESDQFNDKRVDLRISFANRLALPIEIKRDDNSTLWTALRTQLIDRYTIEPKAEGHGIYLVFWFGMGNLPAANDGGKKPTTPTELQARLEAQLEAHEKYRVFVRVVDVSWPNT